MMTKDIVKEIINSYLTGSNEDDRLLIRYSGFQGHGINGVSAKSIWFMNREGEVVVSHIRQNSGEEDKIVQLKYELKDDYLIARYQDYKKYKYSRIGEYDKKGGEYSIIVPYSNITSLEIRHKEEKAMVI